MVFYSRVLQPISNHALNLNVQLNYVILSIKVTRAGKSSVAFH